MKHLPSSMTGDRPTGPLHLGHYVGSLRNRLALQHTHALTLLVADSQAMTDNAGNPQKVATHIPQVMLDYLAVGLDPVKCRFVLQSAVPQLAELTTLLMNLTRVAAMERNPTVRAEITQRGFARDIPAGFLCYPIAQAADILGLGSGDIPVGEDQVPVLETANELIDRLNHRAGELRFARCRALLSRSGRLPGVLGGAKMSKSGGNAIALGADAKTLAEGVARMYTDPGHLRVTDPGQVEGNVVFAYLDAFDDPQEVAELKTHYQRGGLGDMVLKRRLLARMEAELAPIRERRAALDTPCGREQAMELLRQGSQQAREQAAAVVEQVKHTLGFLTL
jgi:tryptophanyl-tRNA synthetase